MKNGDHEGLLLPQVPVEQKWGRPNFARACVKADMPPDCWKDENTDIFRFTAVVFGEHRAIIAQRADMFFCIETRAASSAGPRLIAAQSHADFQNPNTGMR